MPSYVDSLMGNNERVVFTTRKHMIVIARTLFWTGLVAIVIIVASIIGSMFMPLAAFLGALVIVPIVQLIMTILVWSREQYIVTNRRVMRVEGILNKNVADSSLEKVNDVVMVQSWLGRLLDYGNVDIITGSDVGINHFEQIAGPVAFKREMLNQKEAMGVMNDVGAREKRILESDAPTKGDIPELIAELDELRKKGIINDAEFAAKKDDLLKRM
ncbi:MAG: PH domain-containing protein [Chloroflexi bacterium]|nr:PH domain-containing protein [Chloroflexota bacterium]